MRCSNYCTYWLGRADHRNTNDSSRGAANTGHSGWIELSTDTVMIAVEEQGIVYILAG
jgi:hypothetical protein